MSLTQVDLESKLSAINLRSTLRTIDESNDIDLEVAIIERSEDQMLTLKNWKLMSIQQRQIMVRAILEAKFIRKLRLEGQLPDETEDLSDLFRRAHLGGVSLEWPFIYPNAVPILISIASNPSIKSFSLHMSSSINMLTTEQWDAIENSFTTNSTIHTYTFFEGNRFSNEWWLRFVRVIERSASITTLQFFTHAFEAEQVMQCLKSNKSITRLQYPAISASSCQVLVGRGIPLAITNKSRVHLHEISLLRNNLLTEFVATGIPPAKEKLAEFLDALQYNESLKELTLSFDGISSTNIHLARAIKTNKSLTKLNITMDYSVAADHSVYNAFDALALNTSLTSVVIYPEIKAYLIYSGTQDSRYQRYKSHIANVIEKNRTITSLHVHPFRFSSLSLEEKEDLITSLAPIVAQNVTLLEFSCIDQYSTKSNFPELMHRNQLIVHRVKSAILLHNILRHEALFGCILPRELWLIIFDLSWPGLESIAKSGYNAVIKTIFDAYTQAR